MANSSAPSGVEVLGGWKDIATFLKTGDRNAERWAKERGLPVHRDVRGKVYAFPAELEAWLSSPSNPRNVEVAEPPSPALAARSVLPRPVSEEKSPPSPVRHPLRTILATFGVLAALVFTLWFTLARRASPLPRPTPETFFIVLFRTKVSEHAEVLGQVIAHELENATKQYREVEIRPAYQKIPDRNLSNAESQALFGVRASLAIWIDMPGKGPQDNETIHLQVLNQRGWLPFVPEVMSIRGEDLASRGGREEVARQARSFVLATLGITRFEQDRYDEAAVALTDALKSAHPGDLIQPGVIVFYRALAYQAAADTPPAQSEPQWGISHLNCAIKDFTEVLREHPAHTDSYWNRGLTHTMKASFLASRDSASAELECALALDDYEQALNFRPIDPGFLKEQPGHAKILYGRVQTYAIRAKISRAQGRLPEVRRDLDRAATDCGRLLFDPLHAAFLKSNALKVHFSCGLALGDRAEILLAMHESYAALESAQRSNYCLTEALRSKLADPVVYLYRARVRSITGDISGTQNDLRAVLNSNATPELKREAQRLLGNQ